MMSLTVTLIRRKSLLAATMVAAILVAFAMGCHREPKPMPKRTPPAAPQTAAAKTPKAAPKSKIAKTLDDVTGAVVKFEMPFPGGMSAGSGFLIDDRGWVATNYHVASGASTAARVKTAAGEKLELAGVIALDKPRDLAILKLKKLPAQYTLLDISDHESPKLGSIVYTYGHPRNIDFSLSKGIVSRVLTTREMLAGRSQKAIGDLQSPPDELWIQTDAKMLPGSSGGPLLDEACRVVGVNTFINPQTAYGFASHVKYLKELADKSVDKPQPLKSPSEIKSPVQTKKSASGGDAKPRIPITKETLQQAFDKVAAFSWKPQRLSDYKAMTNLAVLLNVCKQQRNSEELTSAADEVFDKIKDMDWTTEQVDAINQFAADGIDKVKHGIVFVGKFIGKGKVSEKEMGLILSIPGAKEVVLVRGAVAGVDVKPDSQLLVLGAVTPATGEAQKSAGENQKFRVVQSLFVVPVSPK